MSWKFDPFIPPHQPTSPEVGFFMSIYPLQPLRRGGAMWASPPTRIMKLQQDGASRTPPPTKFYHLSVRRDRRPCLPAKFVPSSMKKPVIARPVRTLAVGSELSAASGRGSEVSEWPRSKFPASAVRQRGNFGHRNRDIRTPVLSPLLAREAFFAQKKEDASRHPLFLHT